MVFQAQAYRIVGQQKSGPLQLVPLPIRACNIRNTYLHIDHTSYMQQRAIADEVTCLLWRKTNTIRETEFFSQASQQWLFSI